MNTFNFSTLKNEYKLLTPIETIIISQERLSEIRINN